MLADLLSTDLTAFCQLPSKDQQLDVGEKDQLNPEKTLSKVTGSFSGGEAIPSQAKNVKLLFIYSKPFVVLVFILGLVIFIYSALV